MADEGETFMKNRILFITSAIVSLLMVFTVVWPLGGLLMPQRTSFGANWGGFLRAQKDSCDVMFFESSIVYYDIYPEFFSRECGRSAYVLAGPEQNMAMTYYYISEALRTQSPSVVFVEMTEMYFPRENDFQKANIGYMPWGENRVRMTLVPYIAPYYDRMGDRLIECMRHSTAAEGLELLDCNDRFEEFGFDPQRNFYDGLHTNCYGAEKFSCWLVRHVRDNVM